MQRDFMLIKKCFGGEIAKMSSKDINNIIENLLEKTRHLDYLIRIVEEDILERDKKLINKNKESILEKKKANREYKLTNQDKILLEKQPNVFHIELRKAPSYKKGKGFTFLFERGAIINYLPESSPGEDYTQTHLQTHFIICHEIGHILLHMKIDVDGDCTWEFPEMSGKEEKEADDFAEEIMKKMSFQFDKDKHEYLKGILVNDAQITEIRNHFENERASINAL